MTLRITNGATLANGVVKPWLGLGVYKADDGAEVEQAIRMALEAGYRSIDTAAIYENEAGVGKAIRDSKIPREEIFVTTKVWNTEQGYESTLQAFDTSLQKLGLDYIDLYLVHWPVPGKYKETWRALETLYKKGLVRSIGVSNFHIHHLEDLLSVCEVKPMLNQIEMHPYLIQEELRQYCEQHGIYVEAWRPLMRGNLEVPLVQEMAERYQKTPAQIVLRWDLQHKVLVIPKSVRKERIIENAGLFDFELTDEDMAMLDSLNRDQRFGPDPDHFDYK
ncbi:aldo/keto reductase [Brevibacillus laterosporus]|uniref:aldo/keto reductase n=1 Tax=Brevibacillus laterosporus TaxID=1465 RepID=UPI000381443B|nr:aldo/keto reductase [Brevibacillus laterosporus]ATO49941.1 glyoxal reductase [Brevibacillus laterosporus DSM 25]MBG9802738.1 glyoxal reductase [Brevibacillus laterosporus]MED2006402.1 aldo/keto reductase [Brevibacillus laterosporus]MED4764643.1 aldo/keto reductase [Brevibacillus laterosporus]TPH18322.1 aldo/keto reductase [Brevibacillus laterosporus]